MVKKREGGSCAFVHVFKVRIKIAIISNAISPYGMVKIKIKRPRALAPSKERNIIGSAQTARNAEGGTVTE